MRVLTYNFLTSKAIRGVKVGFPLKLNINKMEIIQSEFNAEFITRIIPRLDWSVLYHASELLSLAEGLPKQLPDDFGDNQELLQKIHHLLMEVDIVEGELICPESGRIFPVQDGIPNMLLNEDEV